MGKRIKKISFRVNEDEYNILLEKAKKTDRSLSYIIRNIALNKEVISKSDIGIVNQLSRIGNNLNQMSKWMNTNKHVVTDSCGEMIPIKEVIKKIYSIITTIYDH